MLIFRQTIIGIDYLKEREDVNSYMLIGVYRRTHIDALFMVLADR
jgi:hypothetical protein